MGALSTVVDSVLFFFFLAMALGAPLHDGQMFFPHLFPAWLVDFKDWYINDFGDYLFSEEPHFFIGLVLLQFAFQWPLSVAALYAIAARKPWLNTTCLVYGASFMTTLAAILGEFILSKRASAKLLSMYLPLLGFAVLALLRGFIGRLSETSVTTFSGKSKREKRA